MNNYDHYLDDPYSDYEDLFDPMSNNRQARRKRNPKPNHEPKMAQAEIIEEIADARGLEGGFDITYQPSLYEEGWLLASIGTFFDLSYITDVLALVKGGKEASVYRCEAHPSTGTDLLAAKVYRPRMFRNLRNDAMYRQGREMLQADGKEVNPKDRRMMRAVDQKTGYGAMLQHTSWLMYEYTTLEKLHRLGASVPQTVAASENAILMGYMGDEHIAAPTLNTVRLGRDEANVLFEEVVHNIELLLSLGLVHGDLSAYNILYWDRGITLIDFPQVVDVDSNDNAYMILHRDVTRVCQYFSRQGVDCDTQDVTDYLWGRYVGNDDRGRMADASRFALDDDEPAE